MQTSDFQGLVYLICILSHKTPVSLPEGRLQSGGHSYTAQGVSWTFAIWREIPQISEVILKGCLVCLIDQKCLEYTIDVYTCEQWKQNVIYVTHEGAAA